ncbi:hypothetical protein C8J57DRAFT_1218660 [Mycena rebaudengoi]|nr:hypothetical protein C8J57DRAFT_1218660 [Mycena rebaudengoi]
MPKPSGSQGFSATSIQHATIAASTLKQLGQISKLPYVQVLSGVSLLILETVQNVKRNKDECFAMVGQIDELLCIMIDFLAETLQKIEAYMRAQQDRGRMMRFFRQQEDSAQLEDCKMGLRQALDVFSVSVFSASELPKIQHCLGTIKSLKHDPPCGIQSRRRTTSPSVARSAS